MALEYKPAFTGPRIVTGTAAELTSFYTGHSVLKPALASSLTIVPLTGLPLIRPGDDLARLIVDATKRLGIGIRDDDVLVVGQKAVSKSEGRLVDIDKIRASKRAVHFARRTGKSAGFVEVVLRDARKVVRSDREAFIVTTKHGWTCLNGGVDKSNVQGPVTYALLPEDPDASARSLRSRIKRLTRRTVGVIVCDTHSRPFRRGQVEETIGVAGLNPMVDYRGQRDLFGYQLRFKNVAVADELASAAELVMGQGREAIPAAIIRGVKRVRFQERAKSSPLVVGGHEDLFRGSF